MLPIIYIGFLHVITSYVVFQNWKKLLSVPVQHIFWFLENEFFYFYLNDRFKLEPVTIYHHL